jgi:hypothetical protein
MMRSIIAWTLFWAGDAVSRLMRVLPDDWRVTEWLYRGAYSPLMRWSSAVQCDGKGPWPTLNG